MTNKHAWLVSQWASAIPVKYYSGDDVVKLFWFQNKTKQIMLYDRAFILWRMVGDIMRSA